VEAARSSETSIHFYQVTRYHTPKSSSFRFVTMIGTVRTLFSPTITCVYFFPYSICINDFITKNLHNEFSLPTYIGDYSCMFWLLLTAIFKEYLHTKFIYIYTHIHTHRVKPGYSDIGSCKISFVTSDIPWYQLTPHC
jgi:hypothetical protein